MHGESSIIYSSIGSGHLLTKIAPLERGCFALDPFWDRQTPIHIEKVMDHLSSGDIVPKILCPNSRAVLFFQCLCVFVSMRYSSKTHAKSALKKIYLTWIFIPTDRFWENHDFCTFSKEIYGNFVRKLTKKCVF